jgi:hypothetical protein
MMSGSGNLSFEYRKDHTDDPDATPLSLSMPKARANHPRRAVLPFLQGLLPDNEQALESLATTRTRRRPHRPELHTKALQRAQIRAETSSMWRSGHYPRPVSEGAVPVDGDITGDFHVHLTVDAGHVHGAAGGLAAVAGRHGLSHTRIVLSHGEVPDQPMLTGRVHGTLPEARARADHWVRALDTEGLRVVRVKVEAAAGNRGVPRHDAQAWSAPPERHFEQHVKVLLDAADVPRLTAVATGLGSHVSRNARRVRDDGAEERFVTRRAHGIGLDTARTGLGRLLDGLRDNDFTVIEVEEEYVVHDSNPGTDAGWAGSGRPA